MMETERLEVYRRWNDGFVLRRMRQGEEQQVIRWFGTLEAMPGDLELAMDMRRDYPDVDGFYAGELNGVMVSSLVQSAIADDLKYIGAIFVDEQHRGLGFARRMISTAQETEDHSHPASTVVLDAYQHLVSMYQKFGYKSAYRITTYQGTINSTNTDTNRFGTNIIEVQWA